MAFSGGTFTLASGNPVTTATTISSTWANNTLSDIATGLSTAILKDGTQTVTANIPMATYKFTGLGTGSALTDSASVTNVVNNTGRFLTSVSGTNTVVGTATPTPAYAVGQVFTFVPAATNTGAVTLNVSSVGAGAVQLAGAALTGGELVANVPVSVYVTATTPVFEIIQPTQFTDARAHIVGATDSTKKIRFEVDGLTTATTRVITVPDKDLTIAAAADVIANSLPTTTGDIIYASAASTPARLAAGTANYVLTSGGAGVAPSWAALSTITLGTKQASTSGTSITFTGIPSNAKRITVMFSAVSTNSTSPLMIQLGDSGGIETTGYTCVGNTDQPSATGSQQANTSGFQIGSTTLYAADDSSSGFVTFNLLEASSNTWVGFGMIGNTTTTVRMHYTVGIKATSATLDRLAITTVGGTATFDAGAINISYDV